MALLRPILASPLLEQGLVRACLLGVMALGLGACLLPLPGDDVVPLPGAKNRPPRIEELNVTPQGRIVSLDVGNDCVLQLGLPVADPDLQDLITVRWFVDFDTTPVEGEPDDTSFSETLLVPTGREQRGNASIVLRTNTAGSRLATPGLHLVEAYVSDGRLQVVNLDGVLVVQPLPRDVDADGGIIDSNYVVSYAWFVQTPAGCPTAGGSP